MVISRIHFSFKNINKKQRINAIIDRYKKYNRKLKVKDAVSGDINTYLLRLNRYEDIKKDICVGLIKEEIFNILIKNNLRIQSSDALQNKLNDQIENITCK